MNTEQLYVRGKPFYPETNYEKDEMPKQMEQIRSMTEQMQNLINEIVDRVTNRLLEKTEIAEWAKQQVKPSYTAAEVGAEAEGNAAVALLDAKDYADGTYIQATGYADQKIAELINGAPSTLDTIGEIAAAMLEHAGVVEALEAAIGSKASEVEYQAHAGNSTMHVTASKQEKWDGYETRIAEVFQRVSNGKRLVASAITDRGVATAADAEFQAMADNIGRIQRPSGNAGAAQVLAPYTFSNATGVGIAGGMPNKGAVTAALNAGGSYTIPAGYHNGSGKITANSLASQTAGTATAAHILAGMIAWVKGVKITGSMANRGAVTVTLNAGGSYTVPAGYHNGSGKVTGNSLASQTAGTATAAHILTGMIAWVKGVKITGSMANRGAVTVTLNAGGSYTIPAGYHNGSGKVTAAAATAISGNEKLVSKTGSSTDAGIAGMRHQLFKTGITGKELWKSLFIYAHYTTGGGYPFYHSVTYNSSTGDINIISYQCDVNTIKVMW